MMAKPQTVTVNLKITVDPEEWARSYSVTGKDAIRDDVRRYILNHLQQSVAADECALTAELR